MDITEEKIYTLSAGEMVNSEIVSFIVSEWAVEFGAGSEHAMPTNGGGGGRAGGGT